MRGFLPPRSLLSIRLQLTGWYRFNYRSRILGSESISGPFRLSSNSEKTEEVSLFSGGSSELKLGRAHHRLILPNVELTLLVEHYTIRNIKHALSVVRGLRLRRLATKFLMIAYPLLLTNTFFIYPVVSPTQKIRRRTVV